MWGENWGEMIWGLADGMAAAGAAMAVPVNGWALVVLGIVVGVIGARVARRPNSKVLSVMLLMLVPVAAVALTLPHRFQNGQRADANQVNANFDAVTAAIDANPPLTSIDGLDGGTLNGDLVVTGRIQVSEVVLPNGRIRSAGDAIIVEHDLGPDITLTSAGIALESFTGITLKVGGNTVKLDATGVAIDGLSVDIQGDALLDIQSPLTSVKGDATLILKGGVVLIN
jgi:hypothetical protein